MDIYMMIWVMVYVEQKTLIENLQKCVHTTQSKHAIDITKLLSVV